MGIEVKPSAGNNALPQVSSSSSRDLKSNTDTNRNDIKNKRSEIMGAVKQISSAVTNADLVSAEREFRYDKLFKEIDLDNDGKIDIKDLTRALDKRGHKASQLNAKVRKHRKTCSRR